MTVPGHGRCRVLSTSLHIQADNHFVMESDIHKVLQGPLQSVPSLNEGHTLNMTRQFEVRIGKVVSFSITFRLQHDEINGAPLRPLVDFATTWIAPPMRRRSVVWIWWLASRRDF
jgi:hypothetical protein